MVCAYVRGFGRQGLLWSQDVNVHFKQTLYKRLVKILLCKFFGDSQCLEIASCVFSSKTFVHIHCLLESTFVQ